MIFQKTLNNLKNMCKLSKLSDKQLSAVIATTRVLALTSIPPILVWGGIGIALTIGFKVATIPFLPAGMAAASKLFAFGMSLRNVGMFCMWRIIRKRAIKVRDQRKASNSANDNKTPAPTTAKPYVKPPAARRRTAALFNKKSAPAALFRHDGIHHATKPYPKKVRFVRRA